jgi:hypothetical protein
MTTYTLAFRTGRWVALVLGILLLTTVGSAQISLRGVPLNQRPKLLTVDVNDPSGKKIGSAVVPDPTMPRPFEMPPKPFIFPLNNGDIQPGFVFNQGVGIGSGNFAGGNGFGGGGFGGFSGGFSGGFGGGGFSGGFGGGGFSGGFGGGGFGGFGGGGFGGGFFGLIPPGGFGGGNGFFGVPFPTGFNGFGGNFAGFGGAFGAMGGGF